MMFLRSTTPYRAAEPTRQLPAFSRGRVGEPTTIDFARFHGLVGFAASAWHDIIIAIRRLARIARAIRDSLTIVMNLAINAVTRCQWRPLHMAVDQIAVEAGQTPSSRIAPAHYTLCAIPEVDGLSTKPAFLNHSSGRKQLMEVLPA